MKIITVTLNPCIDVTMLTDGFDLEKVNHVARGIRQAGGKGINVGTVAHHFFVDTMAFCIIGSENKDEFLKMLGTKAGEVFYIEKYGKIRENLTMRYKDETMKFNCAGLTCSDKDLMNLLEGIRAAIEENDIVAVCGSVPNGITSDGLRDFCIALSDLKAKVFVDSENFTLEDIKEIKPFCIKPNRYELAQLFNSDHDLSDDEIKEYALKLSEYGVTNVLITLGENGTVAVCNGKFYTVSAPKIDVRSTVGAGDSMLAGFAIGVSKGYPIEQCLKLASACGSDTASREGVELCIPESVESIIDQVKVE